MLWVEMGRQYWEELLKVWLWWGEDRDLGKLSVLTLRLCPQSSPLQVQYPPPTPNPRHRARNQVPETTRLPAA